MWQTRFCLYKRPFLGNNYRACRVDNKATALELLLFIKLFLRLARELPRRVALFLFWFDHSFGSGPLFAVWAVITSIRMPNQVVIPKLYSLVMQFIYGAIIHLLLPLRCDCPKSVNTRTHARPSSFWGNSLNLLRLKFPGHCRTILKMPEAGLEPAHWKEPLFGTP